MIKLYKRFLLWYCRREAWIAQMTIIEAKRDKAMFEERIKRYEEITNHCGHFKIPEER